MTTISIQNRPIYPAEETDGRDRAPAGATPA